MRPGTVNGTNCGHGLEYARVTRRRNTRWSYGLCVRFGSDYIRSKYNFPNTTSPGTTGGPLGRFASYRRGRVPGCTAEYSLSVRATPACRARFAHDSRTEFTADRGRGPTDGVSGLDGRPAGSVQTRGRGSRSGRRSGPEPAGGHRRPTGTVVVDNGRPRGRAGPLRRWTAAGGRNAAGNGPPRPHRAAYVYCCWATRRTSAAASALYGPPGRCLQQNNESLP